MAFIVHIQTLQTQISPHAVIGVHNRGADAEFGEISNHRFGIAGGFASPATLRDASAEELSFGNHGKRCWLAECQAVFKGGGGNGQRLSAVGKVPPAIDRGGMKVITFEQVDQGFASAGRFGAEQNAMGFRIGAERAYRIAGARVNIQWRQRLAGQVQLRTTACLVAQAQSWIGF